MTAQILVLSFCSGMFLKFEFLTLWLGVVRALSGVAPLNVTPRVIFSFRDMTFYGFFKKFF